MSGRPEPAALDPERIRAQFDLRSSFNAYVGGQFTDDPSEKMSQPHEVLAMVAPLVAARREDPRDDRDPRRPAAAQTRHR
jgi:hypothetical protein